MTLLYFLAIFAGVALVAAGAEGMWAIAGALWQSYRDRKEG